jgi:hypothetical protein
MKNKNVIFELSDTAQLVFESFDQILRLNVGDSVRVIYKDKNCSYLVEDDCIQSVLDIFCTLLDQSLRNALLLDDSILNDIGYVWNKELRGDDGLRYEKMEGRDYWVGLRNALWSTPGDVEPNLTTWLYNDKNGAIVLEITPNYPWHFRDSEPNEKFISYQEFMRGYKPYLKKNIAKDVAEKWLEQAKQILMIIKSNEQDESSEKH